MCNAVVVVSDGLLSHENEEVRERVAALEKKVQQQEDEIVCLKSALSDCIRRITSMESAKGVPTFGFRWSGGGFKGCCLKAQTSKSTT